MLCIQNGDQDNFIRSQTELETWLGYTDEVSEGTWLWFSGCDSTYTHWRGNEPNNHNNEDYAVISWDNGWNDAFNNDGNNYPIYCSCQKPLLLTLSPTTKPTTPPPTTTESNLLLYTSGRLSYIYVCIYIIHTNLILSMKLNLI